MRETAIFIYCLAGVIAVVAAIFAFSQLSIHNTYEAFDGMLIGGILTALLWGMAHSIKGRF